MLKKQDILDLLLDKQEDEEKLNFNDNILEELNDEIENLNHITSKFIDNRVHPKSRQQLKQLLEKQERKIYDLSHRENQLYYRNGFTDAISIILIALTTK